MFGDTDDVRSLSESLRQSSKLLWRRCEDCAPRRWSSLSGLNLRSAEHLETGAVDGNASTSRRDSAKATHTAFLHVCRWFGIQHAQACRALLWPRGSLWTAQEDPTIRMSSDRSLCGVARRSAALAAYMTFEWVLWPSRLPRATAWRAREHMLQAMFRALTVVTESRADGSEAHSSCCGRA